jgi:hypothetical protein
VNEPLYRVEAGSGIVCLDLAHSYVAYEPAGAQPDNPRAPTSEWSCTNPGCATRDVVVSAAYGSRLPPASATPKKCPDCGQPLAFCFFLREVLLVPADSGFPL